MSKYDPLIKGYPHAKMGDGTTPRCQQTVTVGGRMTTWHQCFRRAVVGEYCKTHDPAAVKARRAAAQARWNAQFNRDRVQWHGDTFLDALRKIAAGHNDPRALAQEVIEKFEAGAKGEDDEP